MKNIFIKETALVILTLLSVISICSCEDKPTNSTDSSTISVEETSSQETTSEEQTVSFSETSSDASENTASVEIEEPSSEDASSIEETLSEETSSEETSSIELEETSSEETSSVVSKETSSKEEVTAKACEHEYEKAKLAWDYVGERLWITWGERGIVYPTCTEEGMTVYRCNLCGDVKFSDFVPALGHKYEIKVEVTPTPTKTGVLASKCTQCHRNEWTEVIPKRPGDYSKIDSRMSIKEDSRCVVFEYAHLYIVDYRSWGEPPEITVIADDHAYIVYYKQDGEKVIIDETMKPGGYDTLMIRITDDGAYYVSNILPIAG